MFKFFKSIFIYFSWVIGFSIVAGLIMFFYIPINKDLVNILTIAIFLCIPLLVVILMGLIKGNVKFIGIHSRSSLVFRSAIFMSCLVSFFLLGVSQSAMAQLLMTQYDKDSITNSEKIEFVKDIASRYSSNKISIEYIGSLNSISPNERLTVYYSEEDKDLADKLVKAIPDIETQLSKMFAVKKPFPIDIVLYNDLNQFRKSNDIHENQKLLGLYINKTIHIVNTNVSEEIHKTSTLDLDLKSMNYEQEIFNTLEHEYAHYYVRAFLMENNMNPEIPRWFDEGLAGYYESEGYITDIEFAFPDLKNSAIPLLDLVTPIEWEKNTLSERASDTAYTESFMVVYELIKSKGDMIIIDILKGIPKELDLNTNYQILFEKSFIDHVGLTIEEFQEQVINKYSLKK